VGCAFATEGWDTGNFVVQIGVDIDTWEYDVELANDVESCVGIAENIVAWANAGARPWSGPVFSWTEIAFAGQFAVQFECNTTVTVWSCSTQLQGLLHLPSSAGSTNSYVPTAGIDGTVDAVFAVRHWARVAADAGGVSRNGSWIAASQRDAPYRPEVDSVLSEAQNAAMVRALEAADNPRQCDVYQLSTSTWRRVHPRRVPIQRSGISLYRCSLGDAIG